MDLAQRLVPDNVELGLLFFQPMQLAEGRVDVCALGQQHLIAEHGLQHGQVAVPLGPQSLAGVGFGQAGDGAHLPGEDFLGQRVLRAGVKPQLVCLFGPGLAVSFALQQGFYLQAAARHPQPGQPPALLVRAELEHLGPKSVQRRGRAGVGVKAGKQRVHAVQLEGRAKPAGKNVPPGDGGGDLLVGKRAVFQHGFHQPLVAEGQRLVAGVLVGTKIHKALAQAMGQLGKQRFPPGAGQIHFIDENERGDVIPSQQPPEGFGVALHAVGAGDDQHGVVQHLEGALGLGGKIDVAGGIQQRNGGVFHI